MNQPTTMLPRDMQLSNEYRFSRKHIDGYIQQEIEQNRDVMAKHAQGVQLLEDYRSKTYSYQSKNDRIAQIQHLELEPLVMRIFVQVAYCQVPELFTSVTAQLAGQLGFSEKVDAITTVAEMMAVLCLTDAFDIIKADRSASLVIQSRIPVSEQLQRYVAQSRYLPPMVCEPAPIEHNYQSPYLTHNDCQILGKGNGHTDDICLDAINTQNRVPLRLDLDFLSTVEENPTFTFKEPEQQEQWQRFKAESYETYLMLARQGNRFYLTQKVDKRGRMYAQGYHVTTQGTPFKKAMVELADEEIVEGVPDHLRAA